MPHDPLSAVVGGTYVGLLCVAAVAVWLGGEWAVFRLRKAFAERADNTRKPFIFNGFRAIFRADRSGVASTTPTLTTKPR